MENNCRIGKITLKGGAKLHIFPNDMQNCVRFPLGWGEISFRIYSDKVITSETMVYMLRSVEEMILIGEGEF